MVAEPLKKDNNLDELMKEVFCSCGLPWSVQNWGNLGEVKLCLHGFSKDLIAIGGSGAYPWSTNSNTGVSTGGQPYGISTLSTGLDTIARELNQAGFDNRFSNRMIYELGFKNGQKENLQYTACLNREKELIENTKNTAHELREYLKTLHPDRNPYSINYCRINAKLVQLCSCIDCWSYNNLLQIIGKMERYEYGKTN